MRGYIGNNNKMIFPGLPVGESIRIVSIGVNEEGRSVIAVQEAVIGKQHKKLVYEEQDKDGIKNSLGVLNK